MIETITELASLRGRVAGCGAFLRMKAKSVWTRIFADERG
jgi:hypothetical protein